MKREKKNVDELLRRHLPVTSEEQVESAVERVLRRSESEIREASVERTVNRTSAKPERGPGTLIAVAAIVLLLISAAGVGTFIKPSRYRAVVRSIEGPVFVGSNFKDGEVIRSNGGALLTLADDSRLEMRAKSELSLERAIDGVRIRLHRGSVIVSATEQRFGHLYVQTKDVTVSVIGTVFLVNADQEGSRVAVIQGEVRIQQDGMTEKLMPGKQIATAATMKPLSISEQVSWSLNASAHLALLQQNTPPRPAFVPPGRQEFAAVSIRTFLPGQSPPPEITGFACHGVDGTRRALFGSDADFVAPQGRCVGSGNVFVADVIGFAYGRLGGQYVAGGPDWVRPAPPPRGRSIPRFQIDTVAEDPSSATLEHLTQMLQLMLADRFKLRVHPEIQESPGWSLAISKKGSKLKELNGGQQDSPYPMGSGGGVLVRGKSRLDGLAQILSQVIGAPVVDKTGLSGTYDYEFLLPVARDEGERGGPGQPRPGPRPGPLSDRVSEISDAMEDRLGLILQKEKTVPAEIIVIDQIEMPSPN